MNDDVQVSMFNLVMQFSAQEKTMTEDEVMLYNQCCSTLKAQAQLDELVVKRGIENINNPKPDDEKPGDSKESVPC
jgi:uncharacterized coiled-coil protein SlyX